MLSKKKFASESVVKSVEKMLDYAAVKMELERQESKYKESLFPKIPGVRNMAEGNSKLLRSGSKKALSSNMLLDYKSGPMGDSQIQSRRRTVQSRHSKINFQLTEN